MKNNAKNMKIEDRLHILEKLHALYLPFDMQKYGLNEADDSSKLKALTMDANISSLGYCFTDNALEILSRIYANNNFCNAFNEILLLQPEITANPMYPGFPEQVINMSEEEFRIDQKLHYFSTYGIEHIHNLLGLDIQVMKGWLPENNWPDRVSSSEKIKEDILLDVFTDMDSLSEYCTKTLLSKKERLSPSDVRLLRTLPIHIDGLSWENIPFHENLNLFMEIIIESSLSYSEKSFIIFKITQNPTDIIKFIVNYRDSKDKNWHFTTSQRRALVTALEHFNIKAFKDNVSDKQGIAKKAFNIISWNKFSCSANHKEVVRALRNNELRSWNSIKEEAYANGDMYSVIDLLSTRPGIFVRELGRVLKAFDCWKDNNAIYALTKRFIDVSREMSVETLMNNINNQYSDSLTSEAKDIYDNTLKLALSKNISCRFKNKFEEGSNIFIDNGEYDLDFSKITFNQGGECTNYIAPGMAVKINDNAKSIRFFVFWNDDSKRVDLDLHVKTDNDIRIGWNSNYNNSGITHSGDITHSSNAVEYIDINIEEAKHAGVKALKLYVNDYTSFGFSRVETAFAGLLYDPKSSNAGTKLYNSANVDARIDLTQSNAKCVSLCVIDIEHMIISYVFEDTRINEFYYDDNFDIFVNYSVKDFINEMLKASDCTWCNNQEDADFTISISKAKDNKQLSLFEENWFLS